MNEQPVDPSALPGAPECASGSCRFLGFYSDHTHHAGHPDGDNYCHVSEMPFAVPLDYQAAACLGDGWPQCLAYRNALAAAEAAAAPRRRLVLAPQRVALLAAAVICLALAAYYAIRPGAGGGGDVAALSAIAVATPHSLPAAQSPGSSLTPTRTAAAIRTVPPTEASATDASPAEGLAAVAVAGPTATDTPAPTEIPAAPASPAAATDTPPPPTATAAPTETPTATAMPITLSAPQLISPTDGQTFGNNDTITLAWGPVADLPANAYYVVSVAYSHLGATWYDEVPWTRETSWTLSEHRYLQELADHGEMTWWVQVMVKTGEDAAGAPLGTAVSPASVQRQLIWRTSSGGSKPTALPPPP